MTQNKDKQTDGPNPFEDFSGRNDTVQINGVKIVFVDKERRVSWMSDWGRVYELADRGFLRMEFDRGNYGHCSFFVV